MWLQMPYVTSPNLQTPDDQLLVWRYVDLPKLLATVAWGTLYFPALPQLADRFEGFVPEGSMSALNERFSEMFSEPEECSQMVSSFLGHMKNARSQVCVSCWHLSQYESAAMWDLYGAANGVAIQSTVGGLKKAFERTSEEVYLGLVNYTDHRKALINATNLLSLATNKRLSFEHEKELRALVLRKDPVEGVEVEVDVSALIENIHVSPLAPPWHRRLVERVVIDLGLERVVHRSDLAGDTPY